MPLLPQWLRISWAAAFGVVLVLHLWHAAAMPGQRRWWHTGHTVMALGMLLMYLTPRDGHDGLYRAGSAVFGGLAVMTAAGAGVLYRRAGGYQAPWVASAVDMAVMAFMLLPGTARPDAVGRVLVVYLAGQALAWLFGRWERIPAPVAPAGGPVPPAAPAGSGGTAASAALPGRAGTPGEPDRPAGRTARYSLAVRVSLAVMAAGMAYMLAVM